MKFKYLMIVSLILAIITIGAVSATENTNSTDELTITDTNSEIQENPATNVDLSEGDDDEDNDVDDENDETFTFSDENIYINSEIENENYDTIVIIDNDYKDNLTGTLKISAKDTEIYNKKITVKSYNSLRIERYQLPDLPTGTYNLKVEFTPNGGETIVKEREITVEIFFKVYEHYGPYWYEYYEDDPIEVTPQDNLQIMVNVSKDVSDKMSYTYNGQSYDVNYANGIGYFTIPSANLNFGDYGFEVKFGEITENFNFTIISQVDYFQTITENQDHYVIFALPTGYAGTGYVYNYKYEYDEENDKYIEEMGSLVAQATSENGKVVILMPKLQNGSYQYFFKFEASNSDYKYNETLYMNVKSKDNNVSVTVTPNTVESGNPVTVTITGPKAYYIIYVDNQLVYSMGKENYYEHNTWNGVFNHVLSNLSVGKHWINVWYDNEEYEEYEYQDYNILQYVTVTEKQVTPTPKPVTKEVISLSLKKVTVKKSAKKLVISATLKINKKVAKNKKITFKFNNKKYTAKTNAKGIAKVTIKKNILKKLKVGKKVKYQATYSKTTKSLSVKIKK